MISEKLTEKNEFKFNWNELEFNISAITGDGLARLFEQLTRYAEDFLSGAESALVTRERHRRLLGDALAALQRALETKISDQEDLIAEELRTAARALGRLTGRIDVEDVLDSIFRDFCIGK